MNILNFVPEGKILWGEQARILTQIQDNLMHADVFAIQAPTAAGKTLMQEVLARYLEALGRSATIAVHDNVLVDQYAKAIPDIPVLRKKASYKCINSDLSCAGMEKHQGKKGFCKGCPYVKAKAAAKHRKLKMGNYHIYLAHRLHSWAVIFDEGHKLVDMFTEENQVRIWQSDYGFPDNLKTVTQVVEWLQIRRKSNPEDTRILKVLKEVTRISKGASIQYKKRQHRSTDDVMLQVIPQPGTQMPEWFWPQHRVKKIFLFSATINEFDITNLGLQNRRVKYLASDSPIKPERRPVVFEPCANMAYKYQDLALPYFAKRIEKLLEEYQDKGIIHLPYNLAMKLREFIISDRLMFHSRQDKRQVLERFRTSDPEEGKVLVASGLYEGLDLPHDSARWQVVGKVPYLSLGDPVVKNRADVEPDWYAWETIKRIVQASGRICRTPDDLGITYIFDSNFERLYKADQRREAQLFPAYFSEALHGIGDGNQL